MKHGNNRPGRPHAQVHFPALAPDEALRVVELFERAITAIWRAHGAAIADHLGCVDPESPHMDPSCDAQWSGRRGPGPHDENL